jgi:DNA replicative helicase MCM subunit Mcm2 (Cdc46/Mcm family)
MGSKYRKRLAQVAVNNGRSLIIDFDDLISFDPALARSIVEKPDDFIAYSSSAATAQMRVEDPEYAEHVGRIFARFRRFPEKTALRRIGAEHIKKLALVDGIVVRTTQVRPTIVSAVFRCRKCLETIVQDQEGELIRGPGTHCPFCKQSTSFELIEEQSKFKNTQEARIQERPEDLPPGQLPRYLDIRLEDDLVDTARPGDRVSVTSIVRAEKQTVGERGKLRTFSIYLDANFVDVVGKETEVVEITPEDEKQILEASQDPWVLRKLIMSLAPSIYGYEDVKEGILYSLFGGTAKQLPDGINIRGDENVLLIGDPGTAKSQLLQYVSRIAPRGLYTSGRGTTAAGLCVDGESMIATEHGIRTIREVVEDHLRDNMAVSETGETVARDPIVSQVIAPALEDRLLNNSRGGSLLLRSVSLTSLCLARATQYYRLRSPILVRIRTGLGKEISLTPETRIACYDHDSRTAFWKRAEDVRNEDRILLSTRLPDLGRPFRIRILELADDDDFIRLEREAFTQLLSSLKRKYGTLREAARAIGVDEEKLYYRWRRKGVRLAHLNSIVDLLGLDRDLDIEPYVTAIAYKSFRGIETIQAPRDLLQLMELAGCLYADGCLSRDKRRGRRGLTVRLASGDYSECERYCRLLDSLFRISPNIEKEKREQCYDVRFTNKIVGRLLHSIGLPVGFKPDSLQMHPAISSAPNELLAAFLRGLISHDGWVNRGKSVGFSTSSKRLAKQVDLCMQRFGIVTTLRRRSPKTTVIAGKAVRSKGNYELSIYDGESLKNFQEKIGFSQPRKREKLANLITQRKFSHSNFIRVGSEMITVRVKQVSKEPAEAEVYDLTVDGSHSFLADGFIVHNTAAVLREKTGGMVLEAGALVLADKGVACLHPDSEVFVDGSPQRIGQLFDDEHCQLVTSGSRELEISPLNRTVANLDLDLLQTRKATATRIVRRQYSGKILRIGLDSGMELRLTPDHLVLEGTTLDWKPIGTLAPGDRVVAVQRLPPNNNPVRILDILPHNWIVHLSAKEKLELRQMLEGRYTTLKSINLHYGLKPEALTGRDAITIAQFRAILGDLNCYDAWAQRPFGYGRKRRTERLRTATFTPELGYIIGFVYGDGWVRSTSKNSTFRIVQASLHSNYIKRLHETMEKVSNNTWKVTRLQAKQVKHPRSPLKPDIHSSEAQILCHDSNLFTAIFEWLTRDGLTNLLSLDDSALAGFFAGAVDADGCISIRHSNKKSEAYRTVMFDLKLSNDLTANRHLLWALRRFDVFGRIRPHRGVMSIEITSRADIERLINQIRPLSGKARYIPNRITRISGRHEMVPVEPLRRILMELRPVPTQLLRSGDWSTFHTFRSGKRHPYKGQLQRLIRALESSMNQFTRDDLLALTGSDYALETIRTVSSEKYDGYVYDLRVPDGEHFVTEGVAVHNCIDELDKMRPDDRVAIHEALEQQTVSVAKGGIVATLNARAAVLAAANPALGRYEPHRNVGENINLPVTILSRFDLIFIIKDQPEADYDARMSEHILALHRSKTSPDTAPFAPDFLRKYISFAKRIIPVLGPEAVTELRDFYLKMRSKGGSEAAVAITPRQLEALVRISEARARAFLRDRVTIEDAKSAIRIMTVSLSDVGVDVKTGAMDIDVIMTGKPRSLRDSFQRVIETVAELERETGTVDETVLIAALVDKEKMEDREARRLVGQLIKEGILYSPKPGRLKRTAG